MARPPRLPAVLLLAALAVPLAAGNRPAKPKPAAKALTPVQALALLSLLLNPAGAQPAAGDTALLPPAEPALPSIAGYMDACPLVARESFFSERNACTTDPDPGQEVEGEDAARVAENLNHPWLLEEMALAAQARALDLAACVCRAYRAYDQSMGKPEERDQLLFDRLLATRTQRDALGKAIWNYKRVIFKAWDKMSKQPDLWKVADDSGNEDAPVVEVPWAERVDQLKGMVDTLEAARDRWDSTVKPRHDQLKQQIKDLAKARSLKAEYDATVIPKLKELKAKLKDQAL